MMVGWGPVTDPGFGASRPPPRLNFRAYAMQACNLPAWPTAEPSGNVRGDVGALFWVSWPCPCCYGGAQSTMRPASRNLDLIAHADRRSNSTRRIGRARVGLVARRAVHDRLEGAFIHTRLAGWTGQHRSARRDARACRPGRRGQGGLRRLLPARPRWLGQAMADRGRQFLDVQDLLRIRAGSPPAFSSCSRHVGPVSGGSPPSEWSSIWRTVRSTAHRHSRRR